MPEPLTETAEELYKKLKPYQSPELPLAPNSVRVAGGCANLQKILDLLEDLPKISIAELRIERPDYSQIINLKNRAIGIFKVRTAKYLLQWGIEFKYKIPVSRNFYEALINYVDMHGLFDDDFDWCSPP